MIKSLGSQGLLLSLDNKIPGASEVSLNHYACRCQWNANCYIVGISLSGVHCLLVVKAQGYTENVKTSPKQNSKPIKRLIIYDMHCGVALIVTCS